MYYNGNTLALNYLVKKHRLDRTTSKLLVSKAIIAGSFSHGIKYSKLTKTYAISEFKSLIVR